MELNEIESKIACGQMTAAQVFTQMKQHINNPDKPLPCSIKLPPALTISKGCKFSTLLEALRIRESNNCVFIE